MTEGTLLTPLSIVMAFIGVIEATLAFRVTALQGRAQMIFVWFMVTFPAAVLAGFFYIQITSPISWYPPSELNKTTTERLKFLDRSSQKLASIELIDAANVSKSRTIGSVPQASSAIELYQAGKYEEAVKLFREERTAQRQIPNPFPTGVTRDSSNGSQHRSYIELPRSIRGSHNCLMNSNSGDQNNAFGDEALFANTTSSFNSAFGDDTLHDCTSGDSNVDMGDEAGNSITMPVIMWLLAQEGDQYHVRRRNQHREEEQPANDGSRIHDCRRKGSWYICSQVWELPHGNTLES